MPDKQRPDPDSLLKQVQKEELQQKTGKLKIFFGAAPGVGKTFSMLSEALNKKSEDLDVVCGIVETHGRKDTLALVQQLETLPRIVVNYRDRQLREFDLDAAIKRHPALILVDEMAHTNIAAARHAKRWQDIKELLDRGIDVYTTLNVQHIESLNDVIKQITGVTVRETVPDSIIEMADSIELVDLPPEDLLKRLHEGKVYFPEQAELAAQYFFKQTNLTALRELALRYTAERVNMQVQTQRKGLLDQKPWPTTERLLVCVTENPFSVKLIRTTRRMARSFQSTWMAIYVDSPQKKMSDAARQQAIQHLRFAESLGAETFILNGHDLVQEIMNFAHENNITKIIVGKEIRPRWKDFLFKSLTNEIVRACGDIDMYIITGERQEFKINEASYTEAESYRSFSFFNYIFALITFALGTLINFLFKHDFTQTNIVMVYLVGIILVAARGDPIPAIFNCLFSIVAYNLFFIREPWNFAISDMQHLITALVMVLISQIITHLSVTTRQQTKATRLYALRTSTLHRLSRELASHRGIDQLLQIAVQHISSVFDSDVLALLPNAKGYLSIHAHSGRMIDLDSKERSVAQWAYDLGQPAGLGTQTLPFSKALYQPIQGASTKIGVLRIEPHFVHNLNTPEQLHLLETMLRQVSLAIEVEKITMS